MSDVYGYWRQCHKGEPPVEAMLPTLYPAGTRENPQPGLWKIQIGGGWKNGVKQPKRSVPLQIWLVAADCDDPYDPKSAVAQWRDGLKLVGLLDLDQPVDGDQIAQRWLGAALLKKAERDFYRDAGKAWPEDPPAQPNPAREAALPSEPVSQHLASLPSGTSDSPARGPGDNSGDLETFRRMKADAEDDLGSLEAHLTKNPIRTKADADKIENWAKRIADAVTDMGKAHKAEKAPFLEKCREIDDRWLRLIEKLTTRRKAAQGAVDQWAQTERDRLRKEAEAKARKDWEAQQEKLRQEREAAEAENARIAAENEKMLRDDPVAAFTGSLEEAVELPPAPVEGPAPTFVVPEVTVQVGTGRKRTAGKVAVTAIITDLGKAAAHLVSLADPDLIALIQKRADKAIKAGAIFPGAIRSDAQKEAAE